MGGKCELEQTVVDTEEEFFMPVRSNSSFDFFRCRGQENVKRALESLRQEAII